MKYDYKKAKLFIENNKNNIKAAALGMLEDWFSTAEIIFKDDKFIVDLDDENLKIAGINGNFWATPILAVNYKDGTGKLYCCCNDGEQEPIEFEPVGE